MGNQEPVLTTSRLPREEKMISICKFNKEFFTINDEKNHPKLLKKIGFKKLRIFFIRYQTNFLYEHVGFSRGAYRQGL